MSQADDLVQETLARAWAARSQFESGTNLKGWLFRIARNHHLSSLRRSRLSDPWDPERHEVLTAIQPQQEYAVFVRQVDEAVARLTRQQREALLLVGRDQLSYKEAAHHLRISAATLASRVNRARTALTAMLGAAGGASASTRPSVRANPMPARSPKVVPKLYERWKAAGGTLIG